MIVFLSVTLAIVAGLYLREYMKYRNLHRELLYVNERLGKLIGTSENGFVLIPSENQGIRELSAVLNRLLQSFYLERTDYTRRKQTMNQTLTNISHDLRTPLTVLKGYSEMLNLQALDKIPKDRLRELLSGISKKTDELISAMEENFTLSKLESGDIRLNLKPVNLSLLCREMILDYYDVLEKEGFEVAIQIPEMPLFIQADPETLKRILKNLISNALIHGNAGKYLGFGLIQPQISTLTENHSFPESCNSIERNNFLNENNSLKDIFLIEIEDHGEGIPEKELTRIFDRNYTVGHKSTGNGLGLTIAQGLALCMGGRIEVNSVPGERTVFTLILESVDN